MSPDDRALILPWDEFTWDMPVRDIARQDVVSVTPETEAEEIADILQMERVGSVVVVRDEAPVGIITDRDLGLRIWEQEASRDATAADLMTPDPVTVTTDKRIYDALRVASEANVRRLPIVEDERLVGIVTLDDFIVLLAGELDVMAEVVQAESPSY